MIEFTILELTLIVTNVGALGYAIFKSTREDFLLGLIEAMCEDEKLYRDMCETTREIKDGV